MICSINTVSSGVPHRPPTLVVSGTMNTGVVRGHTAPIVHDHTRYVIIIHA